MLFGNSSKGFPKIQTQWRSRMNSNWSWFWKLRTTALSDGFGTTRRGDRDAFPQVYQQRLIKVLSNQTTSCRRVVRESELLVLIWANLEREKASKPSRTVPFLKPQCAASTFR